MPIIHMLDLYKTRQLLIRFIIKDKSTISNNLQIIKNIHKKQYKLNINDPFFDIDL